MRRYAGFTLLLSLAMLWGCSRTVLVPVPPRMDLKNYGTLGIVEFASNSDRSINSLATRRFQEQIQSAQPGTRFIELGNRETVLAAVGGRQLDADALRKIGEKYGVAAIFLGDIAYSEPKTDVKLTDITRLEGGARTEIRADISSKLVETSTGASVWSSSAWARKQIGRVSVSAERGISARTSTANPREEMVPALVYQLAHDFRPGSVRQPAR
jgi:hypothetical protein